MMYYESQIDLFCCAIDGSLEDCKTTDVSDLFPFDELTVLLDRSENGSISSIEIFPASLVFRQEFLREIGEPEITKQDLHVLKKMELKSPAEPCSDL